MRPMIASPLAVLVLACAGTPQEPERDRLLWPRTVELPEARITVYEPQPETFENDRLSGRAAVSILRTGAPEPVFGAFWFKARISTDRRARTFECLTLEVTTVRLPKAAEEKTTDLARVLEREIPGWRLQGSLDHLLANLETLRQEKEAAANLGTTPPRILVRTRPAVLVSVDGPPVLQDVAGVERVVNTQGFLVREKGRAFYLRGGALWFSAPALEGPWAVVDRIPAVVAEAWAKEPGAKDSPPAPPVAPELLVSTEPAELVVIDGEPAYAPVPGTGLLVVDNTESDLFRDIASKKIHVVLSGRWFRADSLEGPWEFVPPDRLPADFAKLPAKDYGDVLAHVPGTPQAKAAVLDAQIPQTAALSRKDAKVAVTYDGKPQFKKIEGTSMELAVNTPFTVLRIQGRYYCCHEGAWFEAPAAEGPWIVCVAVPKEVSTLPPDCPCYHVKYCVVYDSTPDVVYVGYLPGYYGCYPYYGVIWYGTGWVYRGWYGPIYYPRPVTYGFTVRYNPVSGNWAVGVGVRGPWAGFGIVVGSGGGWAVGVGGGAWGRGFGFSYTHIDVDIDVDRRRVDPYHGRPDALPAGRAASPRPATAREPARAAGRPNNVAADREGNVFQKTPDRGWEERRGSEWKPPESSDRRVPELDRTQRFREQAEARTREYASDGPRGGGRRKR